MIRMFLRLSLVAAAFAFALVPVPRWMVERFYSQGFYPTIQEQLTQLTNRVPIALFDLAIALGVLAATGVVTTRDIRDLVIVGELALDGTIHPARGVLPIAVAARRAGAAWRDHRQEQREEEEGPAANPAHLGEQIGCLTTTHHEIRGAAAQRGETTALPRLEQYHGREEQPVNDQQN